MQEPLASKQVYIFLPSLTLCFQKHRISLVSIHLLRRASPYSKCGTTIYSATFIRYAGIFIFSINILFIFKKYLQ